VIGQTISHYKITAKLGEGGMGVVYKAEDTNLKRPVALKFLAAHLLGDEDVKARFRREAEAAAALNHPNICTVHQIDEFEGKTFIAMAFLEGEGLDKKIEAGPLKLKDALDISIQTAQGLQAAHEKGIVHRDIKPANLMVTGTGSKQHVTIMDFGLAQLADRSKLTRTDETMGTVTYMSPEQTYGMELDHRTDIWSLGVVIYEMVTGQQPFKGHYDKAVMYSITNEEPEPMTALRTGVPMELEWLANKCIAKDIEERYQHTDELLLDLQGLRKKVESGKSTILQAQPVSQAMTAQPTATAHPADHPLVKYRVIEDGKETGDAIRYVAEDTELRRSVAIRVLPQSLEQQIEQRQRLQRRALWGMGAVLIASLALWALSWFRGPSPDGSGHLVRFPFAPANLISFGSKPAAISPDGSHIVFVSEEDGERSLWVRALDRETPRKLEGTEGAEDPFWSPDSQSIGFGTEAELKRIPLSGGEPITLCDLPRAGVPFVGGSWSPDGEQIVYSANLELFQVSSRGGTPKLLFEQEEAERERNIAFVKPSFLPVTESSRGLVYAFGPTLSESKLGILDLETGERRELVAGGVPVYSPSGHIVYGESSIGDSGLRALPFSLKTLSATGEAFPIVEIGDDPSVAHDGTLIYYEGTRGGGENLVWRDREGGKQGTIGKEQQRMRNIALSPDGERVAVEGMEADGNRDIWIHDVVRAAKTKLTFDPATDGHPAWSPSGEQITFHSRREAGTGIYTKPADGSGEAVLLTTEHPEARAPDWSRDGQFLMYWTRQSEDTGNDLWYLKPRASGEGYEPTPYLRTAADERVPVFSPDGRYVAYVSDESGRLEIYVRPFPEGGGKYLVSNNGGTQPRWSRDGKELFYVEEDKLMAVPVSTDQRFTRGTPKLLFRSSWLRSNYPKQRYDISADGQRFVLREAVEATLYTPRVIHVVLNWYDEFRDREQD
jgi:Tol biopolymer transport system component/predicted Ser/Thr protein kinase